MEQRVWLRHKWIRKVAMLDNSGVLNISSSSVYDKLQYCLAGGQAVLIEDGPSENGFQPHPSFQIKLDPTLQFDSLEGTSILTFRLVSADDVGPWIRALSWCDCQTSIDPKTKITFTTHTNTHTHTISTATACIAAHTKGRAARMTAQRTAARFGTNEAEPMSSTVRQHRPHQPRIPVLTGRARRAAARVRRAGSARSGGGCPQRSGRRPSTAPAPRPPRIPMRPRRRRTHRRRRRRPVSGWRLLGRRCLLGSGPHGLWQWRM